MNSKNTKKVRKYDYLRILITETLPSETPLVFSNDGFYRNCMERQKSNNPVFNLVFDKLIKGDEEFSKYTIPYFYKVRKNSLEFRKLALLHPLAQWHIKEFYIKYDKLICYFCSKSHFSIRAPYKVAGTYFIKSSIENINQYKKSSVHNQKTDILAKHSSSYFTYKGYDKLYRFYNSMDFINLEKKFNVLWTMDVSKCFDSIYTHSMSWAIKDKSFTKQYVTSSSTFGQSFDSLMQKSNHNETNGIVIGPEVSRIFAEIIFQEIDLNTCNMLKNQKLDYKDYQIRRYVDDIYIFTKDDNIAKKIYEVYVENLNKFNLNVNSSKNNHLCRPFFTKKSRIVREINITTDEFLEKILKKSDDNSSFIPVKNIYHQEKLFRSFIDSTKSICSFNDVSYDEVASYVIAVFFERIKKLININSDITELRKQYRDIVIIFVEILYFFYSVSPSVNSSYKLGYAIILLSRFSSKYLGHYEHTVKQRIFELSITFFSNNAADTSCIENFTFLEVINIFLAVSDLGNDYLLPEKIIKNIFGEDKVSSYFDLVSCLFYIKDIEEYNQLRGAVIKKIDDKLIDFSDIQKNTEKACLFLDAISCPYIKKAKKIKWLRYFYRDMQNTFPAKKKIDEFLQNAVDNYWFVNWSEIDLLNMLERKQLRPSY